MPTLRPDKGNCWMARVILDGKQVACKMFPSGKKHGKYWREAKEWEEAEKERILTGIKTRTELEILISWVENYLDYAQRHTGEKTYAEKKLVMKDFLAFCSEDNIESLLEMTTPVFFKFLSVIHDDRGAKVANKHRKNLMAAWSWGVHYFDGFPQVICPIERIKPFPEDKSERYVPSDEDFIKVLQVVTGQDLVMLLTFFYTGARRGEIFRPTWNDVNLEKGRIRLTDHKTRSQEERVRWLRIHPELIQLLLWWKEARPCKVDNVFMQTQCESSLGQPFTQRMHFMKQICEKAGVKPFGFHAIRHKSAAIAYEGSGLNAAQILMGHSRATTTDRYVKSAGLYSNHTEILNALEKSKVGQSVCGLVKNKIPQKSYS